MGKWKAAAEDCMLCGEASDIVCPDCGEPMCGKCVRQDVEGTWRCTDCIGREIAAVMAGPIDDTLTYYVEKACEKAGQPLSYGPQAMGAARMLAGRGR